MTIEASCDVAIVGGGIVGLSAGMWLCKSVPGLRVVILEKEDGLARHQTGHNSGVVHAGMYYKPGTQKARMCVEGGRALRTFCAERGIDVRMTGKLIVAVSKDEVPGLHALHQRGLANGIPNLELIGPERLREIEPHARGTQALWFPETGTVDYRAVAMAYADVCRQGGDVVRTGARLLAVRRETDAIRLETALGDLRARLLVNCAGLHSDAVARMAGMPPDVRVIPFRGEYYELAPAARRLVRSLVYPVPDPRFPFLGVHFTQRMDGGVEAGPNAVLAMALEGYTKGTIRLRELLGILSFPGFWRLARRHWRMGIEEAYRSLSRRAFARSLQRLIPEIQESDLVRDCRRMPARLQIGHLRAGRIHNSSMISAYHLEIVHAPGTNLSRFGLALTFGDSPCPRRRGCSRAGGRPARQPARRLRHRAGRARDPRAQRPVPRRDRVPRHRRTHRLPRRPAPHRLGRFFRTKTTTNTRCW